MQIEIGIKSLPSWERGLKLIHNTKDIYCVQVAPFVGAWIEISVSVGDLGEDTVAPFVGAWIEIS